MRLLDEDRQDIAAKRKVNGESVFKARERQPQPYRGVTVEFCLNPLGWKRAGVQSSTRPARSRLPAAAARTSAATTAALARLVAIPAEDRAIATRFKRHCCRLAATRTNHRCSLCRSRTVAGAPLVVLLCLTAILATLWGRITTFLKERLISSGEGEVLPTIAARKLHISGHVSPRGDCTAQSVICVQGIF